MSSLRFVRPRAFADGVVAVVRHPKTKQALPKEGADVDFADIDVRSFFSRRAAEQDVEILEGAKADEARKAIKAAADKRAKDEADAAAEAARATAPEPNTKRASAKGGDAS